MFSQDHVETLLAPLDEHTRAGDLWSGGGHSLRLDFFSAMEPAALEVLKSGHGPGGDPVWMGALLDAGWPEWLVMLMLSLAYAKTGAGEQALQRARTSIDDFAGGPEDAAAYQFVRSCVVALTTERSSDQLRALYVHDRLADGEYSVLRCLRRMISSRAEDRASLEPLIERVVALAAQVKSLEALPKPAFFEARRYLRDTLQSEPLCDRPDRAELQSLVDFVSAALRIDDYTPIHSLEWPQNTENAPWAPTSEERYRSCRESLLWALGAR